MKLHLGWVKERKAYLATAHGLPKTAAFWEVWAGGSNTATLIVVSCCSCLLSFLPLSDLIPAVAYSLYLRWLLEICNAASICSYQSISLFILDRFFLY